MEELLACLKEKKLTIGSCESFTAGLFCSSLASYSGASEVLRGGIVSYATEVKKTLVGVDEQILARFGVISEQCACEMAVKAKALLDCDICVSFTGNAGPLAMEGKPAGLLYCAIAYKEEIRVYELLLQKERNDVRKDAVAFAAGKIIEWLCDEEK